MCGPMMILIVKFLLTMMWESLAFTANIIRAKVDVVAATGAMDAGGSDGFLTLHKNGNGLVDDATEIFGSTNVDGFNVLERLDSNADGKIDANDEKFAELKVWQDTNGNGVVDAGEMKTLTELGITSIDLNRVKSGVSVNGNTIGYTSTVSFADGSTSTAGTAYFATDGRNSTRADTTPTFTPAADVTKLPQLPGSGSIYSIAYRASNDAGFKTAWTALTDNAGMLSPQELREQFTSLLLKWAGVDGTTAGSRGAWVDAGHLAVNDNDTWTNVAA